MSRVKNSLKHITIILTLVLLTFMFAMSPLIVFADSSSEDEEIVAVEVDEDTTDEIDDKSVLFSYASQVINYPQNCGFILDRTIDLEKKNVEVYQGYVSHLQGGSDTSKKYCLYELFGEDVHWYRYMGEATYTPSLLDHIWSAYDQDKIDALSISDIFYTANNYLSCQVYQNRPRVLSIDDIKNGDVDPRVFAISTGWFDGYSYVSGSISLCIAKFITAFMSILMGHTVFDAMIEVLNELETTEFWTETVTPVLYFILAITIIFFIISLVGKAKKYAVGQAAAKEFFARFLVGFMCLGFMLATTINPTMFNNIALNACTIVDQLFEAALDTSLEDDDVISVEDDDLVVKAVVWKTAIFGPWCRGQFNGLEYNELYTNYATIGSDAEKKAMPQSNETPDDINIMEGKDAYFNSTALTGDVTVPIGGGNDVKNWAAYLYSCGSPYHIDYSLDTTAASEIDPSAEVQFPTANTTYGDKTLLADTFRVIDAQMDISPQYFTDNVTLYNYVQSHKLETDFIMQGTIAVFNSLLLLVMFPAIWQKLKNFVMLVITSLKVIYFTILELFKEGNGGEFWSTLKEAFFGYFIGSIKLCILVTLYMLFVDKGLFMSILFILLSIVVYGFNMHDVRKFVNDTKYAVSRLKNRFV